MLVRLHLLLIPLALAACEQLGLEDPAKIAANREAEGKAIGGACRQTARPLEECYALSPKAQKAAIFAGWRDMDAYMRENKIENAVIPKPEDKAGEGTSSDAKSGAEKDPGGKAKAAAKR
ncbi:MAG: hypothetical protein D4S02_01505 [Rhodocyclaceae bacterium]|nr:MAG: hypothetical protein D4S02_01505 [Rhodocyclaceae bacterium]